MNGLRISIRYVAITVFALTLCSSTYAQVRTFISRGGNDANACTSPALPCRTAQRGVNAVAAGGEVVALDSGGYGSLSITKAVTVTGEGVHASITAAAGTAVSVSAGGTDVVVLRSITVFGRGTAATGVAYTSGAALHLENCFIFGFTTQGINSTAAGQLFVSDTVVRDNTGATGISITAGNAAIDRSRVDRNLVGLLVAGGKATARNTGASGNTNEAFSATTGGELNVESCEASNNGTGINSNAATVRVANSVVTNNTTGLSSGGGGSLLSRVTGNTDTLTNTVEGNGADGVFTATYAAN